MSEPLSVLIIDSEPMRRHALREMLKDHDSVKAEAEAADPEVGYHLVNQLKPGIVIFDLGNPPDPGLAAVERFLVASPQSAIFVTADGQRADTILRAVRAGAQEFLVRPVSRKDLLAAIQRIVRQRALTITDTPDKGTLITTFGSKGGRGATVIALNLAAALASSFGEPVVAVDLDLQAGDLSLLLNIKPAYTIYDAVAAMDRIDPLFLKSVLCEHPSGVSLLAAPNGIEEADRIRPLQITLLLSILKTSFAYIVVDTPPTYDERTFAALDAADELLLVVAPDFPSLYHTQRSLDLFERLGYKPGKIKILLNRCPSSPKNTVKAAEEILKRQVFWEFPEEKAVMASLIAGQPLIRTEGTGSPLTRLFLTLASQLDRRRQSAVIPPYVDGKNTSSAPQPQPSKGFRNLFGRKAIHLFSGKGEEA